MRTNNTRGSWWFRSFLPSALGLLMVLSIALDSETAHARKGGIAIINTGEQLFEVGPFPEELAIEDPNAQVGALCSQFGLFWAAVWTWDCRLVIHFPNEESYAEVPPELAEPLAQAYAPEDAKRGFWNRFGILGLVVAIAGFGAYSVFSDDSEDEALPPVDPHADPDPPVTPPDQRNP